MVMNYRRYILPLMGTLILTAACRPKAETHLTDFVNPLLGTATLWEKADLGYERHNEKRTWGAEVFPGAALPNAMVQLTPVTMWNTGAGYQYEDTTILGFAHTAMGHWNYIDLPILPVTGEVSADDYASGYSHNNESARPGYYRVMLDRYGINAELTSTLRTGYHRYTFPDNAQRRLLVNVAHNQHPINDWKINPDGRFSFSGNQGNDFFYYAVADAPIDTIRIVESAKGSSPVAVVDFSSTHPANTVQLRVGISHVSVENARENLERETSGKSFDDVRCEADKTWEKLLAKIEVKGSDKRMKGLFYSTLYRSMLLPRLMSDVNGQYRDNRNNIVTDAGFRYYANPAFWDVYRNQLILLGMLQPDVASDIIKSTIDRGEKGDGFIPSYFHGDHAPTFIVGSYLRGIDDFDLDRAYRLCLKSAMVLGRDGRRYIEEYIANGYITDENLPDCPFWEEHKGGVTKTLEYAYDDYAVAQMARLRADSANYRTLMERSGNWRNLFDPSTGFWRGRVEGGAWLTPYDPYMPYFQQMYREANGWNSLFYAPHDPQGMVALYPSAKAVEEKLDSLFTEPWCGLEVHNMTGFIGNYCHGNQPGHNIPYTYCFIGKQEKCQERLNQIMDRFYDMGKERLAYAGMDDTGEMSAWFVLNAIGLYTYSPADPEYLVTVPIFDRIRLDLAGTPVTIKRKGHGTRITDITCGNTGHDSFFIPHGALLKAGSLTITVAAD